MHEQLSPPSPRALTPLNMTPCFVSALPLSTSTFTRSRPTTQAVSSRRPRVHLPARRHVLTATSAPTMSRQVLVVGAGVIGLTTALRLHAAGHQVHIVAQETPSTILSRGPSALGSSPSSTYCSSGSGGFWMPIFLTGKEIERWGTQTYLHYQNESKDVGVRFHDGFLLSATKTNPDHPWFAQLTNMTTVSPDDDSRVPREYAAALKFRTPIVHMDVYLVELERRVHDAGIPLSLTYDVMDMSNENQSSLWDLSTARSYARDKIGDDVVLVNCAGLGARYLSDTKMQPGRGITARIQRPKGYDHFITEDESDGILSKDGLLAYALPRGEEEYTLGGTIFKGDWLESASKEEISGVVQRAATLLGVDSVVMTSWWTGLRPLTHDGRARVGVQSDGDDGLVVANYGHGGSGVTLCWGCADDVVHIVNGGGTVGS